MTSAGRLAVAIFFAGVIGGLAVVALPRGTHDVAAQAVPQRPKVKVFILRNTNTYIIGDPCTTANCLHIRSVATDQPVRSFNVRTNALANSLRSGTEQVILAKSRNKFKTIYGFTDAQIDANAYKLNIQLTQAEVDQLRAEINVFKAKTVEYSQGKIDPDIQFVEIASGEDVSYDFFEPSPTYFGLWQGAGEVHETILGQYARTDDFTFVVTSVKDPGKGVYYDAPLCDGSLPSTSNYGIPYTWIPMGRSSLSCANHLTWVHGFLHQLADVLNRISVPASPFVAYGSNNYEYFGGRLSCSTNFSGRPYFPDADVAPLDPDFSACPTYNDNWAGYCASVVAQGNDGEECNRQWDRHVLGIHFSSTHTIIGNSCRNGRRDFDETGVDTGGQCSVYGTPPPPSTPVSSQPPQPPADLVRLIRTEGDDRVYAVRRIGGVERRQWVPSPEAFAANGYRWDAVKTVRASELQRYRRASLVRATGDPKVYYVTESGMKRHIPTAAVFLSYGNRWEDVVEVSAIELNVIPDSTLVRAAGDPRVYKLENGQKRWITTAAVFTRSGFDWAKIAPVNQTELNAYPTGPDIQ